MTVLSCLERDAAAQHRLHNRRMALMQLRLGRCRVKQEVRAGDLPPPRESVWYHIYELASLFAIFSHLLTTSILQATQ